MIGSEMVDSGGNPSSFDRFQGSFSILLIKHDAPIVGDIDV